MIAISICAFYVLNIILVLICFRIAKKAMKQKGISWSGSYDATMSCVLLFALIPLLGAIVLFGAILSGECKRVD